MAAKRYNVCCPRPYEQNGEEKTYFWKVGVAFPMRERDGFSVKLYTRVLPSEELVLFPVEENEERRAAPGEPKKPAAGEDDIPF